MGHYHSVSSAVYAKIVRQRAAAVEARHAGRQAAHDSAASSRAAEKRAQKRHEIANRPRGRTEIVGRHEDGSPIYRAIAAFRTRPYTPPADRKERPEPTIAVVNGWRYNVRPTAERIAAAAKAEAPQGRRLWHRAADANYAGEYDDQALFEHCARRRDGRRAARKVRAARIRRQGW